MVSNHPSEKTSPFLTLFGSCLTSHFIVYSQRKSRTWRNSLKSWEGSNNTFQKLKKSSLKTTRRPTLPSSSWEPQNISLPSRSTTERRLRRSWTPSLPVSNPFFTHKLCNIDLKKEQLKWGANRSALWAVKEQQYAYWETWPGEKCKIIERFITIWKHW